MTKTEAAKRFRELANEVMKPWSEVHAILLAVDGRHNRLFVEGCAVKSPSLAVYDALTTMANALETEAETNEPKET